MGVGSTQDTLYKTVLPANTSVAIMVAKSYGK